MATVLTKPKSCPKCGSKYDFRGRVAICAKGHKFTLPPHKKK